MDTREAEIFRIIVIASAALIVCLALIVTAFVLLYKKIKRMTATKLQDEMKLLEAERERIATDLHDELGPSMSAVKICLENLPKANAAEQLLLMEAITEINSCIKIIRQETSQLMPEVLLRHGVVSAIDSFVQHAGRGMLHIDWRHHLVPPLAPDKALHIFRAVQEITYNTIKHAKATTLSIVMGVYQNRLIIETEDNGIGFTQPHSLHGLGLAILQRRVEMIGATIELQSEQGKGTRILIQMELT